MLAGRVRAASVRAGRARRDRRGAGADRRPRGGADSRRAGAAVLAGSVRAQSARARARARTAEGRAQTADPGGSQTADGRARAQTAGPQTTGGRRPQTGGRWCRPQTRAQTADGAGADRRRTPALGHYVLERSGRTCGRGAHPATVPVASSATGGVSPVDEAERRF